MKVLLVALGIYSREGGMERFNRRVLDVLGDLSAEGPVTKASALALWDGLPGPSSHPITFMGSRGSKVRFAVDFVAEVRRSKPDVVLYGHVLLVPLSMLSRFLSPRSVQVLIAHGYEVWDRPSP